MVTGLEAVGEGDTAVSNESAAGTFVSFPTDASAQLLGCSLSLPSSPRGAPCLRPFTCKMDQLPLRLLLLFEAGSQAKNDLNSDSLAFSS